jgi:hypothetical protein
MPASRLTAQPPSKQASVSEAYFSQKSRGLTGRGIFLCRVRSDRGRETAVQGAQGVHDFRGERDIRRGDIRLQLFH